MKSKHTLCATLLGFLIFFSSSCTKKSTQSIPGKITGVISIAPELQKKMKPSYVLFIIAKTKDRALPAAMKNIPNPQFPVEYSLGPENSLMPGTPGFEAGAELTVSARVSRNGTSIPLLGDFEGAYEKNPAHPSDAGVDVAIDHEVN